MLTRLQMSNGARMAANRARVRSILWSLASALSVLGCAGDTTTAPAPLQLDAVHGYWSLVLNHHAVTLSTVAPYDTIRIVATPRNALGAPLTGAVLDSVVTVCLDKTPKDTSLTITPDGLVRARYPRKNILLQVRTTVQGITRVDTVRFNVTTVASPPQLTTFALYVSPDTVTLSEFSSSSATVQALDAQGTPISNVIVRFSVSDTALVAVIRNSATAATVNPKFVHPGTIMLFAETTMYGITMTDSVPMTIVPPAFSQIVALFGTPRSSTTPVGYFSPSIDTVRIFADPFLGTGATVLFSNFGAHPIDVVFDDSAAVEGSMLEEQNCGVSHGGNIPPFAPDSTQSCVYDRVGLKPRFFTTPGTYRYRSTLYGTSGTIVVLP